MCSKRPVSITRLILQRRFSSKSVRTFHKKRTITSVLDKKSKRLFQIPMATMIRRIAAAAKQLGGCKSRSAVPRSQLTKMRELMHETTGPVLMDLDRMFNRKKGNNGPIQV